MTATSPMPRAMTVSTSGWAGAVWIGALDLDDLPGSTEGRYLLAGGHDHRRARFLVRNGIRIRGFVEVDVDRGGVDAAGLVDATAGLPRGTQMPATLPAPMSVVICTRDRARQLRAALESVLALDHPDFEVVVVDNAPSTTATADQVRDIDDPRVRLVVEPRPGLARARNTGLTAARHDLVAFTDDDVVVDRWWLRGLLVGFSRATDVALVSGLVPTGEIGSPAQAWFDQRVSWSAATLARQYNLASPPSNVPLFPFQVGLYGTGANFAVRRDAILRLGGFDPALGVGTPTGGGEDLDIFLRVLHSGATLAREPAAVVWHRHRAELAELKVQARGYGTGLGAWLTKTMLTPALARLALRKLFGGGVVARIREIGAGGSSDPTGADQAAGLPVGYTRSLGRLEMASMMRGPLSYLRSRRASSRTRPAAAPTPQNPSGTAISQPGGTADDVESARPTTALDRA